MYRKHEFMSSTDILLKMFLGKSFKAHAGFFGVQNHMILNICHFSCLLNINDLCFAKGLSYLADIL